VIDRATVAGLLAAAGCDGARDLVGIRGERLGVGSGFFGTITRLRLAYRHRHADAPSSLILKEPSEANGGRAERFALHDRESGFYREAAAACGVRVPHCYSAGDGRLVLEDLGRYEAGDELKGLSTGRLQAAVESIGRLHARWWETDVLADLDWLPAHNAPVMAQLGPLVREVWPAFAERYGGRLPSGSMDLGASVTEGYERVLDALAAGPLTLVHGDFRAANLFFAEAETAVIDWQLCCRGAGAFDVAHLLAGSTSIEVRRRYELHVLRHWYDVAADGRRPYTFRDALDDYRRGVLACVGYAVAGASLQRGNSRGRDVADAQVLRAFTAALDLEAATLLAA